MLILLGLYIRMVLLILICLLIKQNWQQTKIYIDATTSQVKINTDASLTCTANPTAGSSGTFSVVNPNPSTNNGSTLIYYNGAYQIGISTNTFDATAGVKLYVNGDINITGTYKVNGLLLVVMSHLKLFVLTLIGMVHLQQVKIKESYWNAL